MSIFERFRDHVLAIASPGVTTTVTYIGGGTPSRTPIDHPATQAAARALEATFGEAPVFIREGGSVRMRHLRIVLGCPSSCWVSCRPTRTRTRPTNGCSLRNYELGIRAVIRTFDELASLPR